VPVFDKNGDISMVLDVDSDKLDDFSEVDKEGLEALVRILDKTFIA
jgi:GAF domain-containing protein